MAKVEVLLMVNGVSMNTFTSDDEELAGRLWHKLGSRFAEQTAAEDVEEAVDGLERLVRENKIEDPRVDKAVQFLFQHAELLKERQECAENAPKLACTLMEARSRLNQLTTPENADLMFYLEELMEKITSIGINWNPVYHAPVHVLKGVSEPVSLASKLIKDGLGDFGEGYNGNDFKAGRMILDLTAERNRIHHLLSAFLKSTEGKGRYALEHWVDDYNVFAAANRL